MKFIVCMSHRSKALSFRNEYDDYSLPGVCHLSTPASPTSYSGLQ